MGRKDFVKLLCVVEWHNVHRVCLAATLGHRGGGLSEPGESQARIGANHQENLMTLAHVSKPPKAKLAHPFRTPMMAQLRSLR